MTAADPMAAIASYLKDTVGSLVEGRVFRPTLPESEQSAMPRAAIVVKRAGGYNLTGGGLLPVADPRLDIIAYGSTPLEADQIASEVAIALKTMPTHVREDTLLKWARISGGPMAGVDPATTWPFCFIAVQVLHSEEAL